MNEVYDIIFIGAGPASLFCASKLSGKTNFLILEQGKKLKDRVDSLKNKSLTNKHDILFGEGGAGLFSDGKLNFSTEIGGNALDVLDPKIINEIKEEFVHKYRLPSKLVNNKDIKIPGGRCLIFPQYHFGTDRLPGVINRTKSIFQKRIICSSPVTKIIKKNNLFSLSTAKKQYKTKTLIVATGQSNFDFALNIADDFHLNTIANEISIGFRIEARQRDLKQYFSIQYDPKIIFNTPEGEVRTFCSNPGGYIVSEKKQGFTTANGHAKKQTKSNFGNFALLMKSNQRQKLIASCKKLSLDTHDKLIVQNIADFLKNKQTTRLIIIPQHHNYIIGKLINPYLNKKLIIGLQKALRNLLKIEPRLINSILYFPEIKIFPAKIKVKKNTFESKIPNLYFIGDCCGHIHGLWNAILSGLACGQHLNHLKY